jgi:signal transduction histidine kinase
MRAVSDTGDGFVDEHSHDHVITQLFGSGLTVASLLSGDGLDDGIARRLREVLDQLDSAIHELRRIVLMQPGSEHLEPA